MISGGKTLSYRYFIEAEERYFLIVPGSARSIVRKLFEGGESPKEGKNNGGRTLYHFQIKSSSKSDRKLFIYAQIIEFDSIFA